MVVPLVFFIESMSCPGVGQHQTPGFRPLLSCARRQHYRRRHTRRPGSSRSLRDRKRFAVRCPPRLNRDPHASFNNRGLEFTRHVAFCSEAVGLLPSRRYFPERRRRDYVFDVCPVSLLSSRDVSHMRRRFGKRLTAEFATRRDVTAATRSCRFSRHDDQPRALPSRVPNSNHQRSLQTSANACRALEPAQRYSAPGGTCFACARKRVTHFLDETIS